MRPVWQFTDYRQPIQPERRGMDLISNAIVASTNCDPAIAEMSVIAAMSAAAQDGFVIESPLGGNKPLSLLFCFSGPSGTGKTTALNLAMHPIYEHERENQIACEQAHVDYESQAEIYDQRKKRLSTRLSKASESEVKGLEQELAALVENKPKPPKNYQRLLSNTTIEGLFKNYAESCYSPFITADEGRYAMTLLMNERAPMLCKLYDGDDLSISRASSKSYNISSPRLSGILMLQPEVLTDYVEKYGAKSLGSGIWARILAEQSSGYKPKSNYAPGEEDLKCIDEYEQRIREILKVTDNVALGGEAAHILKMSRDAIDSWFYFAEECRNRINSTLGMPDATRAYISRAPENLLRLAGLFHLLFAKDYTMEVHRLIMVNAANWIRYYIDAHVFMFEQGGLDPEKIAEKKLLAQITSKILPGYQFTKTYIHSIAPRYYRGNKAALAVAINNLVQSGALNYYVCQPSAPNQKPLTIYTHNFQFPYLF